jgi:uncharacterized SAM-binding protein YcdF (DUF218 family)
VILLSGGGEDSERSEAELMADVLQVMAVPSDKLLLERHSRDTHDNAVNAAGMLRDRNMQSVLLVTSAFHMRRSQALFEAQGLKVIPAPTDYQHNRGVSTIPTGIPTSSGLARTTLAIHEYVGYWIYRMRGWL